MKKLYTTEKYKRYNAARSRRAMERLQHNDTGGSPSDRQQSLFTKIFVDAPATFSIVENPTETLGFFRRIEKVAYVHRWLYVNIRDVKTITPETVLYLLSFLERVHKNPKIKITGNAPDDPACREIFINSGFYDYVNSRYRTNKRSNILSVRSANYVDGKTADEVIKFAQSSLNIATGTVTRAFYTTILECMGNTKEHG